jgi:hypothetical protein
MRTKIKNEFYIGYADKVPRGISKWLRIFVPFLLIILPTVAFLVAYLQPKSVKSTFEFGIYKELEGKIVTDPFPMFAVSLGEGEERTTKLFLLGVFGKMGAHELLEEYQASLDEPLENYTHTLKGSLIYYAGKTMFELDHGLESFVASSKADNVEPWEKRFLGEATVVGEMLDAKCFLGTMKPGRGKAHRSCAVRCIAGGLPVAISIQDSGDEDYALLLSEEGNVLNNEILKDIGKQVEMEGTLEIWADWKVLKLKNYRLISDQGVYNPSSLISYRRDEAYIATSCE